MAKKRKKDPVIRFVKEIINEAKGYYNKRLPDNGVINAMDKWMKDNGLGNGGSTEEQRRAGLKYIDELTVKELDIDPKTHRYGWVIGGDKEDVPTEEQIQNRSHYFKLNPRRATMLRDDIMLFEELTSEVCSITDEFNKVKLREVPIDTSNGMVVLRRMISNVDTTIRDFRRGTAFADSQKGTGARLIEIEKILNSLDVSVSRGHLTNPELFRITMRIGQLKGLISGHLSYLEAIKIKDTEPIDATEEIIEMAKARYQPSQIDLDIEKTVSENPKLQQIYEYLGIKWKTEDKKADEDIKEEVAAKENTLEEDVLTDLTRHFKQWLNDKVLPEAKKYEEYITEGMNLIGELFDNISEEIKMPEKPGKTIIVDKMNAANPEPEQESIVIGNMTQCAIKLATYSCIDELNNSIDEDEAEFVICQFVGDLLEDIIGLEMDDDAQELGDEIEVIMGKAGQLLTNYVEGKETDDVADIIKDIKESTHGEVLTSIYKALYSNTSNGGAAFGGLGHMLLSNRKIRRI